MAEETKFVISAVDQTAAAFASAKAGLSGLAAAAASLPGVGAAVSLATASLAGFALSLKETVGEMAKLDDAAEQTGAQVEALSAILNTLKPSGVGLEQISDVAGKLTKAMRGADEETGQAAEAFAKLGVSTKDAAGNFRPVDQVMRDLAASLGQYADGTNKVAIAQAIFGKGGAQYLSLLKDLNSNAQEAATVTGEQAGKAEDLEKAFGRLSLEAQKFKTEIANGIIPSLLDLAEKFNLTAGASESFVKRLVLSVRDPQASIADLTKKRDAFIEATRRTAAESDGGPATQAISDFIFGTKQDRLAKLGRTVVEINKEIDAAQKLMIRGLGLTQPEQIGKADDSPGRPDAPKLGSGKRERVRVAAERSVASFTDYQTRLTQEIGSLFEKSDITKAAEYADQLALIDKLFFDGQISAQLYDSAVKGLTKSVEIDGSKGAEKIKEQADRWRDAIDPLSSYKKQLDEINELYLKGALNGQDSMAALTRVYKEMDVAMERQRGGTKDGIDFAKDLGVTFESAFEKALFGAGKLSDVLKGLAQDIARITLRKSLLEPAANWLSAAIGAAAATNTGAGQYNDSVVPYGVGSASTKAVTSGPPVNVYVDSRTDQAQVAAAARGAVKQALMQVYDARARGAL